MTQDRWRSQWQGSLFVLWLMVAAASAVAAEQPNVVIFYADDKEYPLAVLKDPPRGNATFSWNMKAMSATALAMKCGRIRADSG
ncbi:MAG TPA: hypothetical protein VM165_02165 [Planctomycetaceae bacterium]|nr:hypothetical protein [Planctomycetaceae bacterium]